ncbi:MAG: sulfotransferase domain-containing protein [Desulfobacteraceae bacterium]
MVLQTFMLTLSSLKGKRKPAYVDTSILRKISWEPTDIVVAAGPKQGTNWMLNIVHQLRMLGDDAFEDILIACIWMEVVAFPGESVEERIRRIEAHKQKYSFRIFKTHESPPILPFKDTVKYIIPVRNGKDSLISDYYFSRKRTDEFIKLWNLKKKKPESLSAYVKKYIKLRYYWDFINNWWPYRHHENTLMLHFNDLKKNSEKNIRKIAEFLNIQVPEDRWPYIFKYCSFEWMKENSIKFEAPDLLKGKKMIKDGGMIRKGLIGDHNNLFSKNDHKIWERAHKKYFRDEIQREWTDNGGKLP